MLATAMSASPEMAMTPAQFRAAERSTYASSTRMMRALFSRVLKRALSHSAGKSTVREELSIQLPIKSQLENLPSVLLMLVVAELPKRAQIALIASCNYLKAQLSGIIQQACMARLPLLTSGVLDDQRTNPLKFIAREEMKAANCTSNKRAVNALLVHTETQAALMQIAADTMSLYVCQLGRLATSYPALSELDLSNSLAVLSVEDYAEIQQTSLYGHPQARAILAQQAVPIDVQRFLEMVLPHSQEFVLPCLTLLRIKLAKVTADGIKNLLTRLDWRSSFHKATNRSGVHVKLGISFCQPGDLQGAELLPVTYGDVASASWLHDRLAYMDLEPRDGEGFAANLSMLYLKSASALTGLRVVACAGLSNFGFEALLQQTGLQQLSLTASLLSDSDLAKVWSLGHLTSLSLAESKSLAEIGLKAIASLPELKLLDLEGCPNLTAVGLKHLSRLRSLHQVNLSRCSVSSDSLKFLEQLSRLTQLDLASFPNRLSVQVPSLLHLNVASCLQLTNKGVELLASMTKLQHLNLDFCKKVTDDGIFTLSQLTGLTSLSMQGCGSWCKQIGCFTMAALQHMPNLAELNLAEGHFQPLALLPLGRLTSLTQLNVRSCKRLSESDLQAIGSLQRLQHLNLEACQVVTSANMNHVQPLQQLTFLTMARNHSLSDAAIAQLMSMTRLQHLELTDCPGITEPALDKLYVALPKLRTLQSNGIDKEVVQ